MLYAYQADAVSDGTSTEEFYEESTDNSRPTTGKPPLIANGLSQEGIADSPAANAKPNVPNAEATY